jgi:hypothetical protein
VLVVAGSGWVYLGERAAKKPPPFERAATAAACDQFIAEVLKPRFLSEIRPSEFNYPISIYGKWHGSKYRFITRYRSDNPSSFQADFEAPFARLAYLGRDRFDLSWPRHTGEWICLFGDLSLQSALHLIETDSHFQPC